MPLTGARRLPFSGKSHGPCGVVLGLAKQSVGKIETWMREGELVEESIVQRLTSLFPGNASRTKRVLFWRGVSLVLCGGGGCTQRDSGLTESGREQRRAVGPEASKRGRSLR